MEDNGEQAREWARRLADEFRAKHDSTRWFEDLYSRATDLSALPWSQLAPNPLLLDWLTEHMDPPTLARALVVGCGLGDDAEELADWGFAVTGFDISAPAINWCRDRFVGSAVTYKLADLLDPPETFKRAFDFVYEAYTLHAFDRSNRRLAIDVLPTFLAPGGLLLIICRARDERGPGGRTSEGLTRDDLRPLESRLTLVEIEDFYDHEEPPVHRFRAVYRNGILTA
jgi:SAM-dependent methyltransferase